MSDNEKYEAASALAAAANVIRMLARAGKAVTQTDRDRAAAANARWSKAKKKK